MLSVRAGGLESKRRTEEKEFVNWIDVVKYLLDNAKHGRMERTTRFKT